MDQNLVERTKELEELRYNNSELKAQLKQSNKRVDSLTANGNTMLIDELNEKIDNLKVIIFIDLAL
jgi:predicted nuclease with TOPRIM domain